MSHRDIPLLAPFLSKETSDPRDNTWQGDDISGPKDSHVTRVMFHNLNGLSLKGTEGIDMFVHDQALHEVDIQGITEHCLDTTKYRVYQTAQDITRQHSAAQSLLTLHSCEEPAVNVYKPGGTGFLITGDAVSRLEPNGISGDKIGRWSTIHFRRKGKPPITIISAYQVCPRPTNLLGNTAYHQQERALSKAGTPNLHPRQAFIRDLEAHISALQSRGHDIILGGDFNESLTDRRSGILRLITNRNLTDPFLQRYPDIPSFGTHIHGKRRIDMVFVSPSLLSSIYRIGYAPYFHSKPSDHRPLLIEFNTQTLFAYNIAIQSSNNRIVKTNDKNTVTKFIKQWFQQISDNQGFVLQTQLDEDRASPELVEHVDRIIGLSGQQAERACRRRRPEFYSQEIVQQRIRVSILRHHLNSMRMGVNRTPQLQRRMQRIGLDFPLPSSIRMAQDMLTSACEQLQQLRQKHYDLRQQEQILRNIKRRSSPSHQIDRLEVPASWPPSQTPIAEIGHLEDPKACREWKMVTLPHEVEYYLLLRNRLHFGQAHGTPFTTDPLCNDLDWGATTEEAFQVLQGNYSTAEVVPNCQDLLRECRHVAQLDSLPAELQVNDFKGKIRAWKESTTTSPSGRHLGWYKSLYATGISQEQTS